MMTRPQRTVPGCWNNYQHSQDISYLGNLQAFLGGLSHQPYDADTLLFSDQIWENWNSKRSRDLPEATQVGHSRAGVWTRQASSSSVVLGLSFRSLFHPSKRSTGSDRNLFSTWSAHTHTTKLGNKGTDSWLGFQRKILTTCFSQTIHLGLLVPRPLSLRHLRASAFVLYSLSPARLLFIAKQFDSNNKKWKNRKISCSFKS